MNEVQPESLLKKSSVQLMLPACFYIDYYSNQETPGTLTFCGSLVGIQDILLASAAPVI